MRNPDGTWPKGVSGNPGGHSSEDWERLYKIRQMARKRSKAAILTLEKWMTEDDSGKVAVAAAVAMLKVAGCFNDEAAVERRVEERLKQLISEAQNQGPPRLEAVK